MADEAVDLLPPIDERVRAFVNVAYSRAMRMREHVAEVRLATEEDKERLFSLKEKRVLILPNHPTDSDPPVVYGLSRMLGEPFRYAAMDELFVGAVGKLVERLGAFPIKRGTPDRQALKRCQASLLIPEGKLVLFAEGEAHGHNDYVLPLNSGAAQIAFWTMEKLAKLEGDAEELLLAPVAVKYQYVDAEDAKETIHHGLHRVERELGLEETDDSLFTRVVRASFVVLAGIEREYDLVPDETKDSIERMSALYSVLEARTIAMLRIPPPKEETIVLRMRTLFNAAFAYRARLESGETRYEQRLQERREWIADACLADLRRVENFFAVRDSPIEPDASLEQIGERLLHLEREIYGEPRTRPLRTAIVKVAEPIPMRERLEGYTASKRQAVTDLTKTVEQAIREMLRAMKPIATPVPDR